MRARYHTFFALVGVLIVAGLLTLAAILWLKSLKNASWVLPIFDEHRMVCAPRPVSRTSSSTADGMFGPVRVELTVRAEGDNDGRLFGHGSSYVRVWDDQHRLHTMEWHYFGNPADFPIPICVEGGREDDCWRIEFEDNETTWCPHTGFVASEFPERR